MTRELRESSARSPVEARVWHRFLAASHEDAGTVVSARCLPKLDLTEEQKKKLKVIFSVETGPWVCGS